MSNKAIILIAGVPGSGKTWVAKQLNPKQCLWEPHDSHEVAAYHKALLRAARLSDVPVVGEAPFRVSVLQTELEKGGVKPDTYWIVEGEELTRRRYEARDSKPWPKMHATNLAKYRERTRFLPNVGTAEQVLEMLKRRLG